ncbi:hypothetical protein [Microbacterium sp. SORGH_AS_0862]|uniref:hypothetical protein n=1 Tax=Microbacterium sp. SORGH_AS_0862 TaxID=3041789 RepID=UPI00278E5380|nr:hypothetical protein [Microbacterium sp. SORGH_AS_0862]MDQ1205840.1 hypothetical protein [Microbacterium sp. SORGH_AS_0862]
MPTSSAGARVFHPHDHGVEPGSRRLDAHRRVRVRGQRVGVLLEDGRGVIALDEEGVEPAARIGDGTVDADGDLAGKLSHAHFNHDGCPG